MLNLIRTHTKTITVLTVLLILGSVALMMLDGVFEWILRMIKWNGRMERNHPGNVDNDFTGPQQIEDAIAYYEQEMAIAKAQGSDSRRVQQCEVLNSNRMTRP